MPTKVNDFTLVKVAQQAAHNYIFKVISCSCKTGPVQYVVAEKLHTLFASGNEIWQ